MFVEFWGVGMTAASPLPMTTYDISSHLMVDWVPSLPVTVSSSFMGWPPFLIKFVRFNGSDLLTVGPQAGCSERQWRGILSWMLGVAGARHISASEGYRWIAPLSAFYPDAVQTVDLSAWNISFPRSSVVAERLPGSRSRLRPDYLALRSTGARQEGQPYEWAIAEAKGTHICLTGLKDCPIDWYNQARNVRVRVNGSPIPIPRHLVLATRVNPNAVYPRTRRLQVRAWNSTDDSTYPSLPLEAAVDIAAAHLFGLFRNLRLRESARAIALSVQTRAEARYRHSGDVIRRQAEGIWERADDELREHSRSRDEQAGRPTSAVASIETDLGSINVEIAEPVIKFARSLWIAENANVAAAALQEADAQPDEWEIARKAVPREHNTIILPFGVQVQLPREFEPR
jgi:hypothetical protein